MALSYLLVFISRRMGMQLPELINSYLSDLLCLPMMLTASLLIIRKVKRLPWFRFDIRHVLAAWAYLSLVFEYWLPGRSAIYTADPLDVLAYGIGGLAYLGLQTILFPHHAEHTHPQPTA